MESRYRDYDLSLSCSLRHHVGLLRVVCSDIRSARLHSEVIDGVETKLRLNITHARAEATKHSGVVSQ